MIALARRWARRPDDRRVCIALSAFLLWLLFTAGLAAQTPPAGPASERVAVVRGQGALLLDEKTHQAVATLSAGALVLVQGRSADGALLYVRSEANQTGWVSVGALLIVNMTNLPVVDPAVASNETISSTLAAGAPLTGTAISPVNNQPPQVAAASSATTRYLGTGISTARVTLAEGRLNLRAGPGPDYAVVGKAEPGSQWLVIGRNLASDWLLLVPTTGGDPLWGAANYLQVSAPLTSLPVAGRVVAAVEQPANTTNVLPTPTLSPAGNILPTPTPPLSHTTSRVGKTGLTGTLVFQERIGGTIYVYDLGVDSLRPLTAGMDPAISPDGRRVAFTRDGGQHGLYVINLDGSGETRIYGDQELVRSPKWSPSGEWIVFSRSDGYEDCRVLRGAGCVPDAAIIESLPPELQFPDANVENLVKELPNYRVYRFVLARVGANGGDYRDIPSLNTAFAPDWNAAGITYQSEAGIQRTADLPDARSEQVANDALLGYFHDPDWQPEGGRIVFQRKQGSHWQLYIVNSDGSGLAALTRPVTALVDELPSNVSPTWSPDGRYIVYLSNRNSIESAGAWHFWVMEADGANQRMLPIDVVLEYTFSSEQMVSWGP
jgi:hypothetical protein